MQTTNFLALIGLCLALLAGTVALAVERTVVLEHWTNTR